MFSLFSRPSRRRTGLQRKGPPRSGFLQSRGLRTAMAVTELAVGLPLVLIVAFGTIETCTMVRLRQKLKIISYECARVGILPEAKVANVNYQCELLSQDQSIEGVVIEVIPADPQALESGDWFEVRTTAAFNQNSLTGIWAGSVFSVSEAVSIQKP